MTCIISLSRGLETLVDDVDFEEYGRFSWHAHPNLGGFYARRCIRSKRLTANLSLHRLIAGAKAGQVVDHINRNTLDNRRENLRIVTSSQNALNRIINKGRQGFKGAHWDQRSWRADAWIDGVRHRGPRRRTAEEAAHDYDAIVRQYAGEHGRYNFPLAGERSAFL